MEALKDPKELNMAIAGLVLLSGRSKSEVIETIHEIVQTTVCGAIKYNNLSLSTVVMGVMKVAKRPLDIVLYTRLTAEIILYLSAISYKMTNIEGYGRYISRYAEFDEEFLGDVLENISDALKEEMKDFYNEYVYGLREGTEESAKTLAKALSNLNRAQLQVLAICCLV